MSGMRCARKRVLVGGWTSERHPGKNCWAQGDSQEEEKCQEEKKCLEEQKCQEEKKYHEEAEKCQEDD